MIYVPCSFLLPTVHSLPVQSSSVLRTAVCSKVRSQRRSNTSDLSQISVRQRHTDKRRLTDFLQQGLRPFFFFCRGVHRINITKPADQIGEPAHQDVTLFFSTQLCFQSRRNDFKMCMSIHSRFAIRQYTCLKEPSMVVRCLTWLIAITSSGNNQLCSRPCCGVILKWFLVILGCRVAFFTIAFMTPHTRRIDLRSLIIILKPNDKQTN